MHISFSQVPIVGFEIAHKPTRYSEETPSAFAMKIWNGDWQAEGYLVVRTTSTNTPHLVSARGIHD